MVDPPLPLRKNTPFTTTLSLLFQPSIRPNSQIPSLFQAATVNKVSLPKFYICFCFHQFIHFIIIKMLGELYKSRISSLHAKYTKLLNWHRTSSNIFPPFRHCLIYSDCSFLGSYIVQCFRMRPTFRRHMLPPPRRLKKLAPSWRRSVQGQNVLWLLKAIICTLLVETTGNIPCNPPHSRTHPHWDHFSVNSNPFPSTLKTEAACSSETSA